MTKQPRLRFVSTRGETSPVNFETAVMTGQADDGGLFVPDHIPGTETLTAADWESPSELAARLMPLLTGDGQTGNIARDACSIPLPIIDLGERSRLFERVSIVELFHGPTGSFKDFGARFLARYVRDRRGERYTVLVATSGDTGSAVADAFAGLEGIRVVLLYPVGKVSTYQLAQLLTPRSGVFPVGVKGTFDDCQTAVKAAFASATCVRYSLLSANSINIGRLLPQCLFYHWVMSTGKNDAARFVVPSGNLGNLTAGLIAAESAGSAVSFLAAHNQNDFFVRFLAGDQTRERPVVSTLSNAMDVARPGNLERIRWLELRYGVLSRTRGLSITETATRATIREVYEETGYTADPHTAVGIAAARRVLSSTGAGSIFVMSTASPAKYADLMAEETGRVPKVASMPAGEPWLVIDAGFPALEDCLKTLPT